MSQAIKYTIVGGTEGRERLRVVGRVCRPGTLNFLSQIDLKPGISCLDVGCGGGDVSVELAKLVGDSGSVLGLDADTKKLAFAQAEAAQMGLNNVQFHNADITQWRNETNFDLVYSRFLFSHLSNPQSVLNTLVEACKPGGVVALEDIDLASYLCYPPCEEFDSFVQLYRNVVEDTGADPYIGQRLPELMKNAGLKDIQVSISQAVQGEAKLITPLSCSGIRDAILSRQLIAEDKLDNIIEVLYQYAQNPDTLMSNPRSIQAWGIKK